MGFNIGPRVVRATGGSVSRAGNYRIHQFPPDIVTDGLVIHLDTGNVGSLAVNSPTTITDLTGNGNNGAILNGAAYNHNYGGTVLMNTGSSVDDYINVSNGGSNIMEKDFTLDFWLRYNDIRAGNYTNIWSTHGYSNTGIGFAFYTYGNEIRIWGWNTNSGSNTMMINPTGVLANDTWYNIVITRDLNTEKLICYKNAIAIGTANGITADYEKDGDDTYSFGTRDGANYPFDGYTSGMRGYNRALSPAEILQNYEATKLRHSTNYTGTFNPTCAGTGGKVDILCIAGGGGGGTQHGGGGGAGGYLETTGLSIKSGETYTAVVGAGGTGSPAGGTFSRPNGTNGGNSVFSGTSITTMTSVGGGGGSSIRTSGAAGSAGGSGGGAGLEGNGAGADTTSGGAGTSGQGFAGGKHGGYSGTNYGGGAGGGGSNGVGQDGVNGSSYIAGAGGSGKTSSITGIPVTRAGGGGGGSHNPFNYGAGGSGGGGNGGLGNDQDADNAIPRTGSGGGGGGGLAETGGSGAHGIIILRYPAEDYSAEVLIIGGGGSGGGGSDYAYSGGGGGAGGLIYYSSMSISSGKNYLVQIGKAGAGAPANSYHPSNNVSGLDGNNGTNTIFGDNIAVGGGAGGGGLARNGFSGGSGGGGGGRGSSGGKGLSQQGNDGGKSDSHGDTTTRGGGGGGAGSVGGNGSNTVNGTMGDGLAFSITGTSLTYSQGGGGGYLGTTQAQTPGQGGRGANGDGGSSCDRNTDCGAFDGVVYIAYKGAQRGEGGTIDQTSRAGYTIHKFTGIGPDLFIG